MCLEELRKPRKTSVRIVDVLAEIRTVYLLNTSQKSYRLNQLGRVCCNEFSSAHKETGEHPCYSENGWFSPTCIHLTTENQLPFPGTLLSTELCFNPERAQQHYDAIYSSVTRDPCAVNYCGWSGGSQNLVLI
jgi:hypothetical protein